MQIEIAPESYQYNTFTVLGKKMFTVDDFRIVRAEVVGVRHFISQFIKGLHNDAKGVAIVMAFEVLHVLKNKNRRLFGSDNPRHIEKQRALGVAGKTMGGTQRVFLGDARE